MEVNGDLCSTRNTFPVALNKLTMLEQVLKQVGSLLHGGVLNISPSGRNNIYMASRVELFLVSRVYYLVLLIFHILQTLLLKMVCSLCYMLTRLALKVFQDTVSGFSTVVHLPVAQTTLAFLKLCQTKCHTSVYELQTTNLPSWKALAQLKWPSGARRGSAGFTPGLTSGLICYLFHGAF